MKDLSLLKNDITRRRIFYTVIAGILLAFFLPPIILGEDSYITIHDNLDGEFVYKFLLRESGQAFNVRHDAVIPNVMNGVPRASYRTGFDISLLLFYLFRPHNAYIANHIIVHLVAFLGMLLLLKRHFLRDERLFFITVFISLCFALIPFYSQFGLSVAGQPLLLYAFLNIREKKQRILDYLIILLFPFYSHFALVAPFIVSFLLVITLLDLARTRTWNLRFLAATVLLATEYALVEFQMLFSFFADKTFVSHRSIWNRWQDLYLESNLRRAWALLLHTQYHTGGFPTLVIIMAASLAGVKMLLHKELNKTFLFVSGCIAVICLICGFQDWFVYLLGDKLPALRSFNISRFYFLLPLLWLVLLALSVMELSRHKIGTPLIWLILFCQLYVTLSSNTEYINNVRLLIGRKIDEPTYREFFAQDLFSNIDRHIKAPKHSYRVVSIGIHPSIAQFNGYYTLDSYQVNYSLDYKNRFRRIIATELMKNMELKDYFDGWGNRCYIFVDELGKKTIYGKTAHRHIHRLELNTQALKDMGGKYIFSSVPIENYQENHLEFEKRFTNKDSFWDIYLYRVM